MVIGAHSLIETNKQTNRLLYHTIDFKTFSSFSLILAKSVAYKLLIINLTFNALAHFHNYMTKNCSS